MPLLPLRGSEDQRFRKSTVRLPNRFIHFIHEQGKPQEVFFLRSTVKNCGKTQTVLKFRRELRQITVRLRCQITVPVY